MATIVIFGASGGVGRALVAAARSRGHTARAVVRPGSRCPEASDLRVADVLRDPLVPLLDGADAVVSALGLRRARLWDPWSPLTSPPDLCARFVSRLVDALHDGGPRRVVVVSAAGVGDSAPGMNPVMRRLVSSSSIGLAYRDLAAMEATLFASALSVCVVRPVTLLPGSATGSVREVERFAATMTIRRADVAAWMLDRAVDDRAGTFQIAS